MAEHRTVSLMRCSELTRTVRAAGGQTSKTVDKAAADGRVYWLVRDVSDPNADDAELLAFVSAQLGLQLTDPQISALLQNRKDEAQRKLIENIREQPDDVSRILMCLGPEALRRYVPASLIDAVEEQGHQADERMVAEMALAVHGVDILREAKDDLELRGLAAPIQWAGGRAAQEFVRDLGFAREYAGFPEDRLEQVYEAIGPVDLKPLHDFQATVRDRFRALLRTTRQDQAGDAVASDRGGQDQSRGAEPRRAFRRRRDRAVPSCGSRRARNCASKPCRRGRRSGGLWVRPKPLPSADFGTPTVQTRCPVSLMSWSRPYRSSVHPSSIRNGTTGCPQAASRGGR